MAAQPAALRQEMAALRAEVKHQLYWTMGTMIALAGVMSALQRL